MVLRKVLWCTLLTNYLSYGGEFNIPEVVLEAYSPKGFRASIPALQGIELFAFHANINKEITQIDPGEYSKDFTSPTENNMWSYYNPDLVLKKGDEVNYWIFVQYKKLGYRKDKQTWRVDELLKQEDKLCENSLTVVSGKTLICKNRILFEDDFTDEYISPQKWLIEQYIPTYFSSDYEFCSYQNHSEVLYTKDSKLFIKPKPANTQSEVNGELNLQASCTRHTPAECRYTRDTYLILPPVTSARLVSNFKFKYGKVEIRAKLPAGDWIYPQMYLEEVADPTKKLWLGYARGNDKLLAANKENIGGTLLFGGLVLRPEEPDRSQYLRSKASPRPFTDQMHTYTAIWTADRINLLVDGENYGEIDSETMDLVGFASNDLVRLVLGVGVGGINDFPDYFKSGNDIKPWKNKDSKQVKNFFTARNNWLKTWKLSTDNRALQVDSVKITSL